MARIQRALKLDEVTTVIFGDQTGILRLKVVQGFRNEVMVAVTVNTGTDPDLNFNSDDPDTFFIPEGHDTLIFEGTTGTWEVRMQPLMGPCLVQLTDDS